MFHHGDLALQQKFSNNVAVNFKENSHISQMIT